MYLHEELIRHVMESRGMSSIDALADAAGITRQTIYDGFKGKRLTGKTVGAVASAIGMFPTHVQKFEREGIFFDVNGFEIRRHR